MLGMVVLACNPSQRQEDLKFEASLSYKETVCNKKV
jgi:hypothetical protein